MNEEKLFASRYEIIAEIGAGGMAKVYKAKDTVLNRIVAIKMLRPEFAGDEEFTARFTTEAQAAAGLSHQNLVSIFDVGSDGSTRFIVMEYVDGITLKEYIQKQKMLKWQEAIKITSQILMGIAHAHERGIVHRDIKPQNIVVTPTGLVKVMDFGIARATSAYTLKIGDATIGSVHYFSPEQARGRHTDEKSDIYSLGIVLYEMLTGRVPFDGDSPISVAMMHLQTTPISPKEFNVSVPLALKEIVMRAIRKEPAERYQTAQAVLDDLYIAQDNPNEPPASVLAGRDESGDTRVMTPVRNIPKKKRDEDEEDGVDVLDVEPEPYVPQNRKLRKEQEKKKMLNKINEPEEPSPKDKKLTTWAIIAGGFLIFSLVFLTLMALFPGMFTNHDRIPVPDLVGRNIYDVMEEFENDRQINITAVRRPNDTVDIDYIFDQEPRANRMSRIPIELTVFVSSGTGIEVQEFTLPDYRGRDEVTVRRELEARGLTFYVRLESSAEMAQGLVIRHVPTGGATVQTGDEVVLYVSRGSEGIEITMPNLANRTRRDAEALLRQNNLVADFIFDDSDSPVDTVIAQSVAAGATVREFTTVTVTLSRGRAAATPTPTSPPTQNIVVNIPPQNETTHVRVTANGSIVHNQTHPRGTGSVTVPITGPGSIIVRIYLDGVIISTQTIEL